MALSTEWVALKTGQVGFGGVEYSNKPTAAKHNEIKIIGFMHISYAKNERMLKKKRIQNSYLNPFLLFNIFKN